MIYWFGSLRVKKKEGSGFIRSLFCFLETLCVIQIMSQQITIIPQFPRSLAEMTKEEFLEYFGFMKEQIVDNQFEFIEVNEDKDETSHKCTYFFKWVDTEVNIDDGWSYSEFGIDFRNGKFTIKDITFLVAKGFLILLEK
jgi:hypothetical protein